MEGPLLKKKWKKGLFKLDIVFPNLYRGGVYSLALLIFYNIVNNLNNWVCERIFLDKGKITSNLIGFTIHYELDFKNIFKILKQNNIPLTKNRNQILFAGGPCVNNNPESLTSLFDFLFLGEADEVISKILKIYEKYPNKEIFLNKIKSIKGVYVPGKSKKKEFNLVKDLDKISYPLYQPLPINEFKDLAFGKSFILETERGCPYNCKFCVLHSTKNKVRMRSLNKIKEIIDLGIKINKRNKVVIYSPSFVHKDRKDILKYLISKNLTFSVPSIRVESLDEEMIQLISEGGQKTLTLAPETNEKLRKEVNKNVSDKGFEKVILWANKYKIKKLKYYFLIGIPGQEEKDLDEMVDLIKRFQKLFSGKTSISINPMVPKKSSGFKDYKFDKEKIKMQEKYLKQKLGKLNLNFKIASVSASAKEYKLGYLKDVIRLLHH